MPNILCVSHEWSLGFEELRELSNAGFRVIPLTTGFEAVKAFAAREVDAIVVNRRLPDIDLGELISFLRHHDEGIPIVVLSLQMPIPAPARVDAVINKYSCGQLLVPTLEILMQSRSAKKCGQGDDSFVQAA